MRALDGARVFFLRLRWKHSCDLVAIFHIICIMANCRIQTSFLHIEIAGFWERRRSLSTRYARQSRCMLETYHSIPQRSKSMRSFHALGSWRRLSWVWIRTRRLHAASALLCMIPNLPKEWCEKKQSIMIGITVSWLSHGKWMISCIGIWEGRYYTREDAEEAVKYISGTILDDRPIRVDFDWGFQEGRQWGRGRSGGQVAAFSPLSLSLKYEAENTLFCCLEQCWRLFIQAANSIWVMWCGCRSVMNIVQTMILISSLLKIITLGVALWFASKQSMSDFKLGHVHIPLCSLDM